MEWYHVVLAACCATLLVILVIGLIMVAYHVPRAPEAPPWEEWRR